MKFGVALAHLHPAFHLDATIAAHTRGAATVWLADVPAFSIWRGEVDSPDRLRIETRDGEGLPFGTWVGWKQK